MKTFDPASQIGTMPPVLSLPKIDQLSPVYGYRKQPTLVDFPGKLAAVFFTSGCNFRCGFCHNYAMLSQRRRGLTWEQLEDACHRFRADWVEAAVITGGEPTLWDDLPALVHHLRSHGFAVKLDTNGSRPDMLAELLPHLDYVAMDVKCSLERYPEFVGYRQPEHIAEAIGILKSATVPHEFRTTIVPGVHDDAEMARIGALLAGARRYVLQPFLPHDDLPDIALRKQSRTTPQHINQAAAQVQPHVHHLITRGG